MLASLEDIKKAGEEELEEDEDELTNGPSADHTNSNRHVGVVVSFVDSTVRFCSMVANAKCKRKW